MFTTMEFPLEESDDKRHLLVGRQDAVPQSYDVDGFFPRRSSLMSNSGMSQFSSPHFPVLEVQKAEEQYSSSPSTYLEHIPLENNTLSANFHSSGSHSSLALPLPSYLTPKELPSKGQRKRGRKRKVQRQGRESPDSVIRWEDLNIDDHTASIVFSVLPEEKIDQFLNSGKSSNFCNLGSHLSLEQQDALKVVKQRLRAEKKSRREKQRRVHVNNSLTALASKMGMTTQQQDMNSILVHAAEFIDAQRKEIENLKGMLAQKN